MSAFSAHGDLALFAAALLLSGVVSGLIAGMLGVGGGIVIVPVLYHVLSVLGLNGSLTMHVAVATSLATIIPTGISSFRAHAKRGNVDWALLRRWVLPMVIGTLAGTALAGFVSGRTLTLIFGVVALPMAANMAFGRERWRLAGRIPEGAGGAGIAAGIGGLSAMMGTGGGTLGVPIMTLCAYPIHRAVGTASAFGIIIAVPAAIGMALSSLSVTGLPPFSLGYVNLMGFVLIAPVSVWMAPIGARLAHGMDKTRLKQVFALFVAVTATRMLMNALS